MLFLNLSPLTKNGFHMTPKGWVGSYEGQNIELKTMPFSQPLIKRFYHRVRSVAQGYITCLAWSGPGSKP